MGKDGKVSVRKSWLNLTPRSLLLALFLLRLSLSDRMCAAAQSRRRGAEAGEGCAPGCCKCSRNTEDVPQRRVSVLKWWCAVTLSFISFINSSLYFTKGLLRQMEDETFLLFIVIYANKSNVFVLWTIGWTTCRHGFWLWQVVKGPFSNTFLTWIEKINKSVIYSHTVSGQRWNITDYIYSSTVHVYFHLSAN